MANHQATDAVQQRMEQKGEGTMNGFLVRNPAGDYLQQGSQETWTPCRDEATVFASVGDAEAVRLEGDLVPRTLWNEKGEQLVARKLNDRWFTIVVRAIR